MNRRDFLTFLGKSTVVSGVAAAVGLPVVKENVIIPLPDSEYTSGTIYETNDGGVTWTNATNEMFIGPDGDLHVIGSFTGI